MRRGDSISQGLADDLLAGRVERECRQLREVIPVFRVLSAPQQAALLSFTYQCGPAWFGSEGFTTLTRVLREGQLEQMPAALMLYVNPGGPSEATAQIRALAHYGIPVPCGYLHRGPVHRPGGGGHWLIVIGHEQKHVVVHDPWGEPDLLSGATLSGNGRQLRFSREHYRCAGLRLRPPLDGEADRWWRLPPCAGEGVGDRRRCGGLRRLDFLEGWR